LDEGRPVILNTNYMSSVPTDGLIKGDGGSGHAYMVEGISHRTSLTFDTGLRYLATS